MAEEQSGRRLIDGEMQVQMELEWSWNARRRKEMEKEIRREGVAIAMKNNQERRISKTDSRRRGRYNQEETKRQTSKHTR